MTRRAGRVAMLLVAAALVALPWHLSPANQTLYTQMGLAAIVAMGLSLLMGFAGQVSFGQGAFYILGAYVAGVLAAHEHWPTLATLVLAPVATAAAGIAALLPGSDLVLPSLWEQVAGTIAVEWGVRRTDGKFAFTPEMDRCWRWKDELPERRLALVGKHLGRWAALVAPRLVPHVWTAAAERRSESTPLQREIVEAVREHGPCTGPQLRALVGAEKRHVEGLQRALVLTNSHLVAQAQGWPAIAVDLVERRWEVHEVPDADSELARTVLASSGELSAADLGGALGWRAARARRALDELDLRTRLDGDVRLYSLV